ncbi:PrgH/EprH family type III secretion apparatus protein [Aeromonas cavernicola]|uniref:PrgH/EprH family type III secretion apparatus protein n=1 Tax=Aeromonas cavernicola TaxID=1006623 RepID=A0A2H9U8X9_9GAMM|nr:PrgH/EprH family type III secretion apparatus protein [Aeromonas cavernicola]PJG60487.1 PrgH/EprH family type III secretion apparatus protein [Aeromonas cavernicola]
MAIDTSHATSHNLVIRLLNGPLCGCEFLLFSGRTLFVVRNPSQVASPEVTAELPPDTLFIPLEHGGINFELRFENSDSAAIFLRELSADSNTCKEHSASLNKVLQIGELIFALRLENQAWSSEILAYPNSTPKITRSTRRRSISAVIALALITGAVVIALFGVWSTPQKQANELDLLLSNDNQRFQVLFGRNKTLYVAASNERDVSWAQQVIARGENKKTAQVISSERENARMTRWLADNYPDLAYYRLQMDNPKLPQLWISRQRAALSDAERQRLSQRLLSQFPYADQISVIEIDDATVIRQAETELKRQALPYTRQDHVGGVTFVVQGALDDGELLRARQLVEEYYRRWGGRYVQFAIELKDDWLRGRSYQYGEQGYIKMSPAHWYFPKPL